jgi:3-hydroxybutyryl-CoA dehydrogenase
MKVAVMGAGQMGHGIAQVAAAAGHDVVLRDIEMRFVEKGLSGIEKGLARSVEKGKLQATDKDAALRRIRGTTDLKAAADADLVIEAIVEDRATKVALWRDLDAVVRKEAVFASNTSSIPITVLAAATGRPQSFVGMHFFNPVPAMKLVEVIRGVRTSDATRDFVVGAAKKMGKTPVEVNDFPGFISNRVLMPMINEAIFALGEGVASVQAIDEIMKLGMNHPMGPLELADFIGLDTCASILEVLYEGFKDPKYRPAPLLMKKVQAGQFGRKSGAGFYDWSTTPPRALR